MYQVNVGKAAVVESVDGTAFLLMNNDNAVPLEPGMVLKVGQVIITGEGTQVVVFINGDLVTVDASCAACLDPNTSSASMNSVLIQQSTQAVSQPPLIALTSPDDAQDIDIAAIQAAILAGQDPTTILDAPAAGNDVGSANDGFVAIDYDYLSTLATAGYDTAFQRFPNQDDDDEKPFILAAGGQSVSIVLTEGDLQPLTYPVDAQQSVLIQSGSLPLEANSVVFEAASVVQILSALSQSVTANGQSVSFVYNLADNEIVGTSSDGVVVIFGLSAQTAGTDLAVTLTVEQRLPIDHITANNGLVTIDSEQLSVPFSIQAFDGGGNAMLAPVTMNVVLNDGDFPALATDPGVELQEQNDPQTINGQVPLDVGSDFIERVDFAADQPTLVGLTSNGFATQFSVVGDTILVTRADDPNIEVLQIVITTTGAYSVTLSQPFDQDPITDVTVLALGVTVTDKDGDTSNVENVNIKILDGADPDGGNKGRVQVVEGDLDSTVTIEQYPVSNSDTFVIKAGVDRMVPESLILDPEFEQTLIQELNSLTSSRQAITFTTSQAATGEITLTGRLASGEEVLSVVMTPTQDGQNILISNTMIQRLPLDHLSQSQTLLTVTDQQLEFKIPLQAQNSDGDFLGQPAVLTVASTDGEAPAFVEDQGSAITEVGTIDDGQIDINLGSDVMQSVSFLSSQPSVENLTSHGFATDFSVSANVLTVFLASDPSQTVLTVTLATDGSYTLVQSQALDQINADDTTELVLGVTGQDSDNDATVPNGELIITINDGIDPSGAFTTLANADLREGSLSTPTGQADGYPASDTASFTFAAGIDRLDPSSITIDPAQLASLIAELTADVLSAGQALSYSFDATTNTLTGELAGQTLLVITFSAVNVSGSSSGVNAGAEDVMVNLTLTQNAPLDHNINGNSQGLVQVSGAQIAINLPLQMQDTDGDDLTTTALVELVLRDGDNPIINSPEPAAVLESDIDGNADNHQGSNPSGTGNIDASLFTVTTGSDEVVTFVINTASFNQRNPTLTSDGALIELQDVGSGVYQGVVAGAGQGGADKVVFEYVLQPTGSYTFTLLGALDHSVQGADTLVVQLPIQAQDQDGDLSEVVNLAVVVTDDVANGRDISFSMTEGAGATNRINLLPAAHEGADDATVTSIFDQGQEVFLTGTGFNSIPIHDDRGVLLGQLRIRENGRVEFIVEPNIDHDSATLTHQIPYKVTDGDGDIALSTITLNIADQSPIVIIEIDPLRTFEDVGRIPDPDETIIDPPAGTPVFMQVSIGDADRGERIGEVLIQVPTTENGDFYHDGVKLDKTPDGQFYIVPMSAFTTTDGIVYEMNNVSFLPTADFSTINGNLNFAVQVTVDTDDVPHPPIPATFTVTVLGLADIPTWDLEQTQLHYTGREDEANIALQLTADLNDTDGSETLFYIIEIQPDSNGTINGTLVGNGLASVGANQWRIAATNIDSVQVNPNDNYSGDIRLTAVAQSEELAVFDVQNADSVAIELVVNVLPVADNAVLKVTRIESDEDVRIALGNVITLSDTDDTDGSEARFILVSGLPVASKVFIDDVEQTPDADGKYEVPIDQLSQLTFQPTPESNLDFELTIEGKVVDTAVITDAAGNTQTVQDVLITPATQLEVALTGVADIPDFVVVDDPDGSLDPGDWQKLPTELGVETLILEDGTATLNFDIVSGEDALKQSSDNSETVTLVISNIPAGVQIFDATGNPQTLTFVGNDASGNPMYEVNLLSLQSISVVPPLHSTADIELKATLVTTEDDGDQLTSEGTIKINIAPVIDAVDFTKTTSNGALEDTTINIDWQPTADEGFIDNQEQIVGFSIDAIPSDYTLLIDGTVLTPQAGGAIVLTLAQINALQTGSQLQLQAPQDSDRDLTITTRLTIEQIDPDGEPTATKEIVGSLVVDIRAVVEPDGVLQVEDSTGAAVSSLQSSTQGVIDLSNGANSQGLLNFVENDAPTPQDSSDEIVRKVVISFPTTDSNGDPLPEGFVVVGGFHDGEGNWVVPESQLNNIQIVAPSGYTGTFDLTISGQVQDQGDSNAVTGIPEGDTSSRVRFDDVITLDFTPNTSVNTNQAGAIVVNNAVITGDEDRTVDLGVQLGNIVSVALDGDQTNDVFSLVIQASELPSGVTIGGTEFDFVNGEFVIQVPVDPATGEVILTSVTLTLAEDFAGDFDFPVRLVTTDITSGDVNTESLTLQVRVAPIVDVPNEGNPEFDINVVQTAGLDAGKQPISETGNPEVILTDGAYEDGIITLALAATLADISTSLDEGLESVEQATLSVDAALGAFLVTNPDGTVTPTQSITVSSSELDAIQFQPFEDYSGPVSVSVDAVVIDNVTYDLTTPATASDSGNVITSIQFDVIPVNDDVQFSGTDQVIVGEEEQAGGISLGAVAFQLDDIDGSESMVSVLITNVPDGFLIGSPARNLGDGEWKVTVPANSTSFDLSGINLIPPKDFSGDVELGITVFTKENLLSEVAEKSTTVNLTVTPIGDRVDSDITTVYQGTESASITLELNVEARDKQDSVNPPVSNVTENPPESLLVTISNVPDSSTFEVPTNGTAVNLGGGVWQFEIALTQLDSLVFNPVNANGEIVLAVNIRGVDNGVAAEDSLATNQTLTLNVTAENDAPINVVPTGPLSADEDLPLTISNIVITDVDARENNGDIAVALNVNNGLLTLLDTTDIIVTGQGTGALQITGQIDAINTALAVGLSYQGNPDFHGNDTLTVFTNDNGNTGTSGPLTDTKTVDITVQPKPDIPTLTLNRPQTATITAATATLIPLLGLMAAVANPVSDELTIVVSGLNGGVLVDSNGDPLGTTIDANSTRLTPAELTELHISGLSAGATALSVQAQSTVGGETEVSVNTIGINITVEASDDLAVGATASPDGNLVIGGDDPETLTGGSGNDILEAAGGNDILTGGLGDDILTGGSGDDLFLWRSEDIAAHTDEVTDFELNSDQLDISQILDDQNSDGLGLDDLLASITASGDNSALSLDVNTSGGGTQVINLSSVGLSDLGLASGATSEDIITQLFNQQAFKLD
ncbi:retention module-containing protein [Photobacterium sanguinicancri]|uniref:Retention module-containing protein n=1 Tax=Photobacterium sanguinicancri TaxID=875932 RepID=A0AAW7Y4T5_9GAMM|nr:retention module-containing protein [Photobacterium sanguinicancri]MDO6543035.1 retention module-containing protein [Photobacterium sanguinicancri]